MIKLVDPVQRHIYAIMVRDAIVRDDASDMALVDPAPKRVKRELRALLAGVDFVGEPAQAALDDPPGRRVGRVAFNPLIRALWSDDHWSGPGPTPHRLPESEDAIGRFILQQTHIGPRVGQDQLDPQVERLLGFSIHDHARNSNLLRINGAASRLFISASMLSAATSKYEKARGRTVATGRSIGAVDDAAVAVEVALIGTARIAAEILINGDSDLARIRRIAMHLTREAEAFRRIRSLGNMTKAVRMAAAAANDVHFYLTRGTVKNLPLEYDRQPERLGERLKTAGAVMETAVRAMLDDVAAVDGHHLFLLLMARRLDVALARHSWLAAPHPIFRLSYAYIGGHALFAELERLGTIVTAMEDRERLDDGAILDSVTLTPTLATAQESHAAIKLGTAPGRYLDLGVYHRAVTTEFIRRKAHWLSATVPNYTHHAYANGSRFCDLASAAADFSTHDFLRQSELDKPTQWCTKRQGLVRYYGLGIEDTVILALRQILDRLISREASSDDWRVAFGRTVHRILQATSPSIAKRLGSNSTLGADHAKCKGIANRATNLARRFDDRDYDGPTGAFFDYALWFDRDRDIEFWDRLQRGAKLHAAFGPSFIPAPTPAQNETLPGRQGRRATFQSAPPSQWRLVMLEAKKAFDAYHTLYLKSRPNRLTARIMARMNQGYSAFGSDPQFSTLFRH